MRSLVVAQGDGPTTHEKRRGRQAREDVARQLGPGHGKEGQGKKKPREGEEVQSGFPRAGSGQARQQQARPGEESGDEHRQVIERRARMVVDRGGEALHVVIEQEDVDEGLPLRSIDREIPRPRHEEEEGDAGGGDRAP
jgi:hypothetical protein